MIEMDLVRYLGRISVLLATPSKLTPGQLKKPHAYARRLGRMCDYLANNDDGKGESGLAGTIRAELTILIHILDPASKPGRIGRPPKGAPSEDERLALAEYNAFQGRRKEALLHLQAKGLIIIDDENEIEAWIKRFARLNEKAEQFVRP